MKTLLLAFLLAWAVLAWAVERDPNEGPPKNFKVPVSSAKKLKTKTKAKKQTSPATSEITFTAEKAVTENAATGEIEEVVALEEDIVPENTTTPESEEIIDEEDLDPDTAKLFALDPTPTPLPQLDPESEAFFTEVDELNEYFHQLKQPPAPTPTVAPLQPPLPPPQIVFRALLKKGAEVQQINHPDPPRITKQDYFVQAAVDDYRNPVTILDRQGQPRYQTARRFVVDLDQDLNLKLSPLTNNPQQAWLKEDLRRNDPPPTLLHRFLAGAGESTLQKTSLPALTKQSLLHTFLEYQLIYYWPFPVRLGLGSTINYERYKKFTWPSWSLGPVATYHFLWGRQQFEIIALWQYLIYSRLQFADPELNTTPTVKGGGSFWQLGLNYLLVWQGKIFPCGIFYQRGSYNLEQKANYTHYDLENAPHRLHAIGIRLGWQWD